MAMCYRLSSQAGANNTVGDRQNLHDRLYGLSAARLRMLRPASAAAHLRILLPQGQRCYVLLTHYCFSNKSTWRAQASAKANTVFIRNRDPQSRSGIHHHHHHHHLFGTLNMVHEVQLVNNNMTEQLNSDPRTLKSLFSL